MLALALLTIFPSKVGSWYGEEEFTTYTPQSIERLAYDKARQYGINEDAFVATMRGESMHFKHLGQSLIPADGPNGREDSWGVCQIHLPSHPRIEKQWAVDPAWCLEWSAIQFSKGRATMWTAYRNYINSI